MRLLRRTRPPLNAAGQQPAPTAGWRSARPPAWLRVSLGICRQTGVGAVYGLALSGVCLWGLQIFWPDGDYFKQVQVPLAQRSGLLQRAAVGWVRQADALIGRQPDQALASYARALGILDSLNSRDSALLKRQIEQQSEQLKRADLQPSALPRESWGEVLSRLPSTFDHRQSNDERWQRWLDALLFYPLVQEPQIWVLVACSLWLAERFTRSVREQLAWTQILDQSVAPGVWDFSPVRNLPELLGLGLGLGLLGGLVLLSPSVPVLLSVVLGAAVPVGLVAGLNAYYSRRSQQALDAWEVRYRTQFSSELHNTAQQSLMGASSVIRELLSNLENSPRSEDARLAWRLAVAAEHCRAAEDELRLLRNGTEDMFARGQRFGAALDPIRDRLEREGITYTLRWWINGASVPESQWEQQAFIFDTVADRRIAATLYQVASELTWNAVKYAHRPATDANAEPLRLDLCFHRLRTIPSRTPGLLRDRPWPEGVRLSVSDNGPGFDLREAYVRRPGSGLFALGRYLRRLEAVGARARYWVDTRPGHGSRFTIDILTAGFASPVESFNPPRPAPLARSWPLLNPFPLAWGLAGGMAVAALMGGLSAVLLSPPRPPGLAQTPESSPCDPSSGAVSCNPGRSDSSLSNLDGSVLRPEGLATARALLAQVPAQQILEQAEIQSQSGQLGDLVKAIQKAGRVPPSSLVYRQAQSRIQDWSRQILRTAERQAEQIDPDAPQAQAVLDQAIAMARLVPEIAPDYSRSRTKIRDWQKQQAKIRRQRELETLARVQALQAQATQVASPEAQPTLEVLALQAQTNDSGVDLRAEQVEVQGDGSFQLSLVLINRTSERFTFLVSQVTLLDLQAQNILSQVHLEGAEDGYLEPGESVRIRIRALSTQGWSPPYQVRLPEVEQAGGRVLNLSLP